MIKVKSIIYEFVFLYYLQEQQKINEKAALVNQSCICGAVDQLMAGKAVSSRNDLQTLIKKVLSANAEHCSH